MAGDLVRKSPTGTTQSMHLTSVQSRRKSLGQFLFSRREGFWVRVRELRAWTGELSIIIQIKIEDSLSCVSQKTQLTDSIYVLMPSSGVTFD
jgi:hypothetical protein